MTLSTPYVNSPILGEECDIFIPTLRSSNKLYLSYFLFQIFGNDDFKKFIEFLDLLDITMSRGKYLQIRKDFLHFIVKFVPESEIPKILQSVHIKSFKLPINFYFILRSILQYFSISFSTDFITIFENVQSNKDLYSLLFDQISTILPLMDSINEFSGITNFILILSLIITSTFKLLEIHDQSLIEESKNIKRHLLENFGENFFLGDYHV